MRVVVDTNVLISGILWLGIPHRIIELAEEKRITLCMTQPMLDELGEVLQRRKFARYLHTRRTSVEEILSALIPLVELYSTTEIIIDHIADPDDTMFLVCAFTANAEFLISGDDHLLRLKQSGKVKIVNPADFVRWMEAGND